MNFHDYINLILCFIKTDTDVLDTDESFQDSGSEYLPNELHKSYSSSSNEVENNEITQDTTLNKNTGSTNLTTRKRLTLIP